ncbi:phage tail protein [Metapseudomonas resinovorans]|uniref:phage tail protein n=1 Tax=Metapseudomonas resinovorans TaxID=53412 RepID=UPI0004028C5D|nr:phage tail protein [Pseudomonas resinovorans]
MAGYDAFRLEIRGDSEFLQRLWTAPDRLRRLAQMALNRVGRGLSTQSWRAIRDEINLKPSYIRDEVNYIPATEDKLRVIIFARKRGVTLSQFPHKLIWKVGKNGRRVRAGVEVNVGHDWTELVEGAFIARMGPPGGLIAERAGRARLPLDVLHGPSPSQVLGSKLDELSEQGRDDLEQELQRLVKRFEL